MPASLYADLIVSIAPLANERWVEAWMRLEHGTLDALGRERFGVEVRAALACIDACTPSENEALARSYGL